jgi:hypothetical protein
MNECNNGKNKYNSVIILFQNLATGCEYAVRVFHHDHDCSQHNNPHDEGEWMVEIRPIIGGVFFEK